MIVGWLTSTALVALVIATLLFPWQKEVEHALQIRKEKIDLYRSFLAQAARTIRHAKNDDLHNLDVFIELECLAEEISILAFDDAAYSANKFVANLGLMAKVDADDYVYAKDAGDLRILLNSVTIAMRNDVRQTRPWPLGRRYAALELRTEKKE